MDIGDIEQPLYTFIIIIIIIIIICEKKALVLYKFLP